jgi:hypothetical protein
MPVTPLWTAHSRTLKAVAPAFVPFLFLLSVGTHLARGATFGAPAVVTDQDAGEPGIDVAQDGAIYVNAPAGLLSNLPGSASLLFRSDDGGATWRQTPAGLRANFPGGGDSDVSLDPQTGAIAFTDLWLGSATVSKSTDKGETWTSQPVQGVVVQDRQWVANAGAGIVYHVTHQIPAGLVVSKSLDGGVTYPVSSLAAHVVDQTGCVCPPGTLIAEGGGGVAGTTDKVGVIYPTSTGGVKFAHSGNGGVTFTNSTVSPASSADTVQAFPVVANAGSGHLVAVWLEIAKSRSVVKYSDSRDWGSNWSASRSLVSSGTPVYPWVDARNSKVAVSVYHTSDSQATPSTVPESAQWYEKYLESTDGGATFSALQTVDPMSVKSGPICTEGTGCNGDRELLDFQSVAVDASQGANLTWTRSLDGVSDTQIRFSREG